MGKLLIEAQGGEERAKYGNELIKEYFKRLTNELVKFYTYTALSRIRQFYFFFKSCDSVTIINLRSLCWIIEIW